MLLEEITSSPEPLVLHLLKKLLHHKKVIVYISNKQQNGEHYSPPIQTFSPFLFGKPSFSRPHTLFGLLNDITEGSTSVSRDSYWYLVLRDGSWATIPIAILDEFTVVNVKDNVWLLVNDWLEKDGMLKAREYLGIKEQVAEEKEERQEYSLETLEKILLLRTTESKISMKQAEQAFDYLTKHGYKFMVKADLGRKHFKINRRSFKLQLKRPGAYSEREHVTLNLRKFGFKVAHFPDYVTKGQEDDAYTGDIYFW